jgi:hypothetical protein
MKSTGAIYNLGLAIVLDEIEAFFSNSNPVLFLAHQYAHLALAAKNSKPGSGLALLTLVAPGIVDRMSIRG